MAGRPPSGAGSATFKTTHWSGLRSAREGDAGGVPPEEALANLCRDYWYPLYAYVRGCHFSPEDAQDLTQAFFERLIEKDLLAAADPARGRFRWFLLTALQNFLRNEIERAKAEKRGGRCGVVSWDALEAVAMCGTVPSPPPSSRTSPGRKPSSIRSRSPSPMMRPGR
ncbi:MAG: RNA polymerase sigma factor [Verrucomicrobiota bacterium]